MVEGLLIIIFLTDLVIKAVNQAFVLRSEEDQFDNKQAGPHYMAPINLRPQGEIIVSSTAIISDCILTMVILVLYWIQRAWLNEGGITYM